MLTVYLNFNGQAAEAARFYAQAFGAPDPQIMFKKDMPPQDDEAMNAAPDNMVIHAEVQTYAGTLWLSDGWPGAPYNKATPSIHITISHNDQQKMRDTFNRLAEGGEITMPLETAFFSPLHGQLRDKYGFYWLIVADEETK